MLYKSAYGWGLLGRFLPQGIYMGTTMVLARFLSPEDFGTIGVLSIIFLVANVLVDSGLGGSLVKEKEITDIDCSTINVFNCVVSILLYLIIFVLADYIESFYAIPGLSKVVRTISLVFPFTAFGIVPKAILNRNLAFKSIFYDTTIAVVVASVVSVVCAVMGMGVFSLVAYQLVVSLMTTLLFVRTSHYKVSISFSLAAFKRIFPFGFFTTLVTIVDTVYENLLTSITGKFLSVQQAGLLYQAKRTEETCSTSLATTIGTVSFPIFTKLKDTKDLFYKESLSTIKVISSLAFPLLIILAAFSYELLFLLYGEQWTDASWYLKIFTFAGVFMLLETMLRNFIKALCEVKKLLIYTIVKRAISIVLLFWALFVDVHLTIYVYLSCSILGFLINSVLYLQICKGSVTRYCMTIIISILPCMSLYFLLELPYVMALDTISRLGLTVICLLVLYGYILPKLGVNIMKLLSPTKRP